MSIKTALVTFGLLLALPSVGICFEGWVHYSDGGYAHHGKNGAYYSERKGKNGCIDIQSKKNESSELKSLTRCSVEGGWTITDSEGNSRFVDRKDWLKAFEKRLKEKHK